MPPRRLYHTLSCLAASTLWVTAQPGPFTTLCNSNLVFNASTLLTNGLPGLTGPAANLMVFSVQSNSAQNGQAALAPATLWTKRYNGPGNYYDQPAALALDSAGNVIVTGASSGSGTSDDYATIKYSPTGTVLWTNRFNGAANGSDSATAVAVDGADNVYVTGKSDNSAVIVTIKYASNGTPAWTNRFTDPGITYGYPAGLAVDPSGNVYLSAADLASSTTGYIIVKYDTAGTPAWTNHYLGTTDELTDAGPIALDNNGNLLVTGWTYGNGVSAATTLKYASDGTPLWTNRLVLAGSESAYWITVDKRGFVYVTGDSQGGVPQHVYLTVKYSNAGTPLWTNLQAAPSYTGGGVPINAVDVQGEVFVTGATPGSSGNSADFTTVKLSSNGVPQWTNRFASVSAAGTFVGGTAVDSAGNSYLATFGTRTFGLDYITVKYDPSGKPQWTNTYNGYASSSGNRDDEATAIKAAPNGDVFVTGFSSGGSTTSFDYATLSYSHNVRYTPPTNFTGIDTLTFIAYDTLGSRATGTVTVAVLPLSLQFNTATNFRFSAQGMRLQVDGARGTNAVVISVSTNLTGWQPIATSPPVLGSVGLLDTGATNSPRRFYRANQTP